MNTFTVVSLVTGWGVLLFQGVLLWGALQMIGRLTWRMDQLELTTPSKVGRNGLKPGRKAPDFTLPDLDGRDVSLHDFEGRQLLLVFMQHGCGPCNQVVPELNRMCPAQGGVEVLVIHRGEPEELREWARSYNARFTVLCQQGLDVSRRYEAYATPFGFLIDEGGVIRSKGIANSRQAIGYLLEGAFGRRAAAQGRRDDAWEAQSPSVELTSQHS